MGVDLLVEAVLEGEYDPACARIETALRGIWALYTKPRAGDSWQMLGGMGLDQETFEPLFQEFGDQYDIGKHLRTDRQTIEFLSYFRRVDIRLAIRLLSAAVWMIGEYMTRRRRMRAAWYGERIEQ